MATEKPHSEKKIFDACPHCGEKLSPWQQVLLGVDRVLVCKKCWYRIMLEGQDEAGRILYNKGVHVIPDILASAGGVTVSYFEMVQDRYSFFWDEKVVHQRLDTKITKAYHAVQEAIKDKKVHPRLAAMVVGVARVAEACKLRGWV